MAVIDRHFPLDQVEDTRLQQALQILTTEQFHLQSVRSATISESLGRLSTFLTTISGVLIALGFVGQAASFGSTFKVFALILLPALLVLGIVSCARVAQTSMEDAHSIIGINRIHHFYVEVMPEIADYLVGSIHDDLEGGMQGLGLNRSRWQPFLSIVALMSLVNSLIAGVLCALAVSWATTIPLVSSVVIGIVIGLMTFIVHVVLGVRMVARKERSTPPLFPSVSISTDVRSTDSRPQDH
jgi:hypothetical protein